MQLSNFQNCTICDCVGDHDFHHWDYETERGMVVCRDCHAQLHNGDKARPSQSMGDEWLIYALKNLVKLHLNHGGEPNSNEIVRKYNLESTDQPIVGNELIALGHSDKGPHE